MPETAGHRGHRSGKWHNVLFLRKSLSNHRSTDSSSREWCVLPQDVQGVMEASPWTHHLLKFFSEAVEAPGNYGSSLAYSLLYPWCLALSEGSFLLVGWPKWCESDILTPWCHQSSSQLSLHSHTCVLWQVPSGILFSPFCPLENSDSPISTQTICHFFCKAFSDLLSRTYPLSIIPLSNLLMCQIWSLSQRTILL